MSEIAPVVSVIIPTFNRAHLIRSTIVSALGQSLADIEVLVVDDCSPPPDNTAEVVAAIGDPRLRYIRREKNGGLAATRNAGIRAAKGTYVALLDDDDEWLVRHLELQVHALEKVGEEYAMIQGGIVKKDGQRLRYLSNDFNLDAGSGCNPLGSDFWTIPSALVIRKRCLSDLSFDESLAILEDWDFTMQVLQRYKALQNPELSVIWHRSSKSMSTKEYLRPPALRRLIEKHGSFMSRSPDSLARNYQRLGKLECRWGPKSSGRRALIRSIQLRPTLWDSWRLLIASFLRPLRKRTNA